MSQHERFKPLFSVIHTPPLQFKPVKLGVLNLHQKYTSKVELPEILSFVFEECTCPVIQNLT